jgi:hypothetical protein
MAQYWKYNEGQVQYRTDISGLRVRFGQLGGLYATDAELVLGGFALAENVGWEKISPYEDVIIAGGKIREGVVSEYGEHHVVIEGEKTTIGNFERIQTFE